MATYKIVNGDYTIQTQGVGDSITLTSSLGNARADVVVDGNLTVTGNTSLTGNLSVSQIFSGNSNVQVLSSGLGGNVTIGVNGVGNVAVFANTGAFISGVASATGNVTGANINTGGLVSATGNVNGGNINTAGNVFITRNSSVTQPTFRFTDTNTSAAANTVVGAVEWFTSDSTTPGARVTSAIRSTYTDAAGNARLEILTGTTTTPSVVVTVLPTGNVGIANTAPNTTLGVTGTAYISGNTTVLANIAGGNIITAGLVTATGNINGGNIITAGLVTATGNINGGNLVTAGSITAGAGGILATGNIRGGNLVSDAQITAVGNITGTNLITQGIVTAQGNVIGNNFSAGNVVSAGMIQSTGNISATGNVRGANLVTGGFVSSTGNVNAGAVFSAGQVYSVGNITAQGGAFFIGDGGFLSNVTAVSNVAAQQIANGTTVLAVASSNGNIFATINAIGNVMVLWPGGANFNGVVSATGNVGAANVNTAGNVSVTGNVNAGNIFTAGIANIGTLLTNNINANALTSGTISSDRLSGSYVINVTGNVSGTAATVTNGAQSNITSLGILTSLSVSGSVNAGGITANGAGLTNVTAANIAVATSTANTTFAVALVDNSSSPSAIVRDINLTYNPATDEMFTGGLAGVFAPWAVNVRSTTASTSTATGALRVIGGAGIAGNVYAGAFYGAATGLTSIPGGNVTGAVPSATSATSATTAGTVTGNAQANITSVGTLTSLSVSGNITSGNLSGTSIVGTLTTVAQNNITSVGTLSSLSVTGNVTSGNVNTGIVSATGNITTTANISGGNLIGTIASASQNNITSVGTLSSLTVTANITSGNLITSGTTGILSVNSITHTGTNAVGNIGSASSYFNQVFATATTALYADLAEKYTADAEYPAGTVVSFGGTAEVTASTTHTDRRVAGVVSDKPSYLMNAGLEAEHTAVVALQGRVPCLVQGPVVKGDMMVSAGNGRAQACDNPPTGAVIGKALENFDGDFGTIEVVVGRI